MEIVEIIASVELGNCNFLSTTHFPFFFLFSLLYYFYHCHCLNYDWTTETRKIQKWNLFFFGVDGIKEDFFFMAQMNCLLYFKFAIFCYYSTEPPRWKISNELTLYSVLWMKFSKFLKIQMKCSSERELKSEAQMWLFICVCALSWVWNSLDLIS